MSIPCADSENSIFDIFGNCRRQLNFAVAFRVNDGKYLNILPTPILPIPHPDVCMHEGR